MRASASDREHFEEIARATEAQETDSYARAAACPPGAGMLVGLRLGLLLPKSPAIMAEDDARADGQMELARRRLALGLGLEV